MTFDDLVKLPRLKKDCKDGQPSQLGLWIQATEDGDTEMADMVMSVMAEQTTCGVRDDRGIPMCGGTPGHAGMLLRRIDLRERSNG